MAAILRLLYADASASVMPSALSRQPRRDALDGLVHVGGRARVAEAQKFTAMNRIEIDAWRRCHAGLLEHLLGERKTVAREARHVGIKVERPIRRQECPEARSWQPLQQELAIVLVAVL